jgi:hypothetical protein
MLRASFVLRTTASRAASSCVSGERGSGEGGGGLVLPLLRAGSLPASAIERLILPHGRDWNFRIRTQLL